MSGPLCIVDYGVGNRRSVEKALEKAGVNAVISGDPDVISNVDGVVIPGVGAFPSAIQRMRSLGIDQAVAAAAAAGSPILGACLGMQLLFDHSDEHGGADGLGLIAGDVIKLDASGGKLPHIGWSDVSWARESPLTAALPERTPFYHVHSYVVAPANPEVVVGWSDYGTRFASVVQQDNIYGVQFHPEKSSTDGLRMLANFGAICSTVAR